MKMGSVKLVFIMAALALSGASFAQSSAKESLLEMRKAYYRRDLAAVQSLLPKVRGHALESLADYWAARLQLESATPGSMRTILDRHPGTYWQDRLRNDWLLELGRRGDWTTFQAELPLYRMNDDPQVKCYALMLRARQGELAPAEAARQVKDLWMEQRTADDGCAMAAKMFLDQKLLSPEDVWRRARVAMENRRIDVVVQTVSMINPRWAEQVRPIAEDPARFLDGKLTALRPETREMVTLALIRLAARDPAAAAAQLGKARWRTQLLDDDLSWAWATVGKWTARSLKGDALAMFGKSALGHMDIDHQEWWIRAALRASDWPTVLRTIDALPESVRAAPEWVYWRARALLALGQPDATTAREQATELLFTIAGHEGFYEQLATEMLGRRIVPPPPPQPLTELERSTAERHPGLQRALTAMAMGLRGEGAREWHYSVKLATPGGMNDRELLAAADLACQREIWDRCINTSRFTQVEMDFRQRFPTPHRSEVLARTRAIGLDPAYVYGLIRQESRFVTDAQSGVGASGLMQVMPATARWTARKIGLDNYTPQNINDFDTNLAIGTAYLKLLVDDFEGSLPMAAAGYNAGPGRPRSWRNGPILDGEAWIENIPFDETRNYVKQVLANTTTYAAMLTGQSQSLKSRLGKIAPRPSDASPEDDDLP